MFGSADKETRLRSSYGGQARRTSDTGTRPPPPPPSRYEDFEFHSPPLQDYRLCTTPAVRAHISQIIR